MTLRPPTLRPPTLALVVAAAWGAATAASCGSDAPSVPSTGSEAEAGGPGGADGGDAASGEGEGEATGPNDPACLIGQVLQDGQCLERCGTNGPVCDPAAELCVLYEQTRSCRKKCGRTTGDCPVGELCLVLQGAAAVEGFCAAGDCPDGSHPGADGWCVCDTGDIPPADVPCKVVLCGPGNPDGDCADPTQICFSGQCR